MAEKLKSISRQIHWSSLLRAAVFSAAWLFLPFWAFVIVALYLYFVPWFGPGRLFVPFAALLILAYIEPAAPDAAGFWSAIVFGAVFYCILLVKDLLVLDRRAFYEAIIFALALFLLRDFYRGFDTGVGGPDGGWGLFMAFFAAGAIALLIKSFFASLGEEGAGASPHRRMIHWLFFLILVQLCVAGLFLPLDFTYQSIAVFLIAAPLIDLTAEYLVSGGGGPSRNKVAGTAGVVAILFVFILSSAHWGL